MGSVLEEIDCPHCSNEATLDFYYKTGEEYIMCNHCGYYRAQYIDRSDDYEDVSEPKWITDELKNPYGVYRIQLIDHPGYQIGSLENEKHWIEFVADTMQHKDQIKSFTLNRFINNRLEKTIII